MTASVKGRQIALITYSGWNHLAGTVHRNRNAEADESTVLYAYRRRIKKNPAMELVISVMLHKNDDSEWTMEELSPVSNIRIMDVTPASSPLGAEITLSDNRVYEIYFDEIDGNRRC